MSQPKTNDRVRQISAAVIGVVGVIMVAAMFDVDDIYDDIGDSSDANAWSGRIAVAADGQNMAAPVSADFGQAQYFLIVESYSGRYTAVQNPFRDRPRGAGMRAAQLIADKVDDGVITGDISVGAAQTLHDMGLAVYPGYSGTAAEAVVQYRTQRLSSMQNNVTTVARRLGLGGGPGISNTVGQAPTIGINSMLSHEYRGVCGNCHQVATVAAGTPVSGLPGTGLLDRQTGRGMAARLGY